MWKLLPIDLSAPGINDGLILRMYGSVGRSETSVDCRVEGSAESFASTL